MLTINTEVVRAKRQSNECFTIRLRFTLWKIHATLTLLAKQDLPTLATI